MLPNEDLQIAPVAALLAVAVALTSAGIAGFHHRDLA
jgi:putative exporter of polyketide antibiotics